MDSIKISNLAIGLVGGSLITSFSDPSVEAEQCGLFYDTARRICLEGRDWTFAATTRRLAPDSTAISSEYSFSFPLPSDCLVVRVVSSSADLSIPEEYQRQSNRIMADAATVYVKYTRDVTDSNQFSAGFATAVAHKLAEFISPAVTGDKALKRTLMQEAEFLINESGATDGLQGSPKRTFASRLLRARFAGPSWDNPY